MIKPRPGIPCLQWGEKVRRQTAVWWGRGVTQGQSEHSRGRAVGRGAAVALYMAWASLRNLNVVLWVTEGYSCSELLRDTGKTTGHLCDWWEVRGTLLAWSKQQQEWSRKEVVTRAVMAVETEGKVVPEEEPLDPVTNECERLGSGRNEPGITVLIRKCWSYL